MADPTSSIPVMRKPTNYMAAGPNGDNLASSAMQMHPIDRMQRSGGSSSGFDLDSIRRLYGSGLAMRLATERHNASNVGGRLPGMDATQNSNAMIDTITGDDMTINFEDFLFVPGDRPESTIMAGNGAGGSTAAVQIGPHAAMEAKLRL
mmetsp:Transcript_5386/g.7398  ORF Transcript_5386/g.7398 Transcript_5386/m.7398 type:complete len:149 (-) Transcript_5386:83-529(-)|eukprot:CAMPEP_0185727498 /NCGR_PEP_ID=MMETSP1171-20130828/3167_1 /TAXON_ID=374046 /ORGANISM="Helicotheca tamensis, Strain CCMP826" /LENGTH=148 /DNA_ID=CAMNT_0028396079 /DNA_START=181 /DNA_END=627 /DNA_ORIENTATION=+